MYSRRHLLLYYYKYKDSPYFSLSIFFLLVLVAFLLLTKVVLPQMYDWFSINNEVSETRKRIATIESNISYVNSLNQEDLAQKRTIFVRALPYEKDIQGILTTISSSAISSGTKLDDFSLSIGEISSKNPKPNLSSLHLNISAKSPPATMRNFIANLQTRLPLVEISSIELHEATALISLSIYYKAIPIFKVNDAEPIEKISGKFENIYSILSEWSANTDTVVNTITPEPTEP